MVIDTSALVAILTDEPDRRAFIDAIASATVRLISAATVLEAGIVMEAHPKVGDTYSQEDAPGVAEDMATVLSLDASRTVPYGTFDNLLKTRDFSPLEPSVVERKFYAAGIGSVLEKTVKGPRERVVLVRVVRP